MPNQLQASIVGTLVGFESYSYNGFTGNDGRVVAGGMTYKVWVSLDVNDAPQAVKCKVDAFGALHGLGFGEVVNMDVTYRPKGQALEMSLDAFERAASPANGKRPTPASV